jgi:alkaline phosphatase
MNKNLKSLAFLLLLSNFLVGCSDHDSSSNIRPKAKNFILFIGDGMGAEHRKAARWAALGKNGKLSMDDMPTNGLIETRSADSAITDSAAAATAMATGVKTNNGVIALDANLSYVSTILEDAKSKGKLVGLVTTTHLTHATPAAFASHIDNRGLMTEIAEQMLVTGVDVLLGGGEDEFLPISENGCFPEAGERSDGRNLINEAISIGYMYVCDTASFTLIEPDSTYKLLGIFADEGMTRPHSPTLANMTSKAIQILSKNSDGFFLMVEGGQIDWASHKNDAVNAISDTIAFDDAVEIAKQFASKANDTLIIVTADHETGGMIVSSTSSGLASEDGPFSTPSGDIFYVNWSTTGHTAVNVPVTSQGPSSDILDGVNDNTFIHDVLLGAL